MMFVTEGIIPFLYFAPRRTRMLAFWLTVLLQVNIMATANYGFFNLLTIALAVTLTVLAGGCKKKAAPTAPAREN